MIDKYDNPHSPDPPASLVIIEPAAALAANVLLQAVRDLAGSDLLLALDALGWWLSDAPAWWLGCLGIAENEQKIFVRAIVKGGKHAKKDCANSGDACHRTSKPAAQSSGAIPSTSGNTFTRNHCAGSQGRP